MRVLIATLIGLIFLPGGSQANPKKSRCAMARQQCVQVQKAQVQVRAQVAVAQVQVPVKQFIATQFAQAGQVGYGGGYTMPTYGAGYQAGGSEELLKELLVAIRQLNATLERAGTGKAVQGTQSSKAVNILVNKCAACHDSKLQRGMDNDFTLFEGGKMLPLTSDTALACLLNILTDRMPKRGQKLSDQEVGEVVNFLDDIRSKSIKKKVGPGK